MKVFLVALTVLLFAGTVIEAAWPARAEKCPRGWSLYEGNSCLSLIKQQEPWGEARRQCGYKQPGADLATVDCSDKKTFIHTMVHANPPPHFACGLFGFDDYWIGANDQKTERRYEWLDTMKELDYTNWAFLEPNNIFGEDCVEMRYSDGKWKDEGCGRKNCFVCEIPASY